MLFINYILIIPWLALFRLGILSALVMLPLTILAITLNYLLLDGRKEVKFWCMNLLGSTLVGIGLSTYMYARYINPESRTYVYMVMEMLTFAVIILISSMIAGRMNAKRVRRKAANSYRRVYSSTEVPIPKETGDTSQAGRLAQSYIDEAEDEALSQMDTDDEEEEEEPRVKFKMVVKGRGDEDNE